MLLNHFLYPYFGRELGEICPPTVSFLCRLTRQELFSHIFPDFGKRKSLIYLQIIPENLEFVR